MNTALAIPLFVAVTLGTTPHRQPHADLPRLVNVNLFPTRAAEFHGQRRLVVGYLQHFRNELLVSSESSQPVLFPACFASATAEKAVQRTLPEIFLPGPASLPRSCIIGVLTPIGSAKSEFRVEAAWHAGGASGFDCSVDRPGR